MGVQSRTTYCIDTSPQLVIFGSVGFKSSEPVTETLSGSRPPVQPSGREASRFSLEFVDNDPSLIFIGAQRLDAYLESHNQLEALRIRSFLRGLSYTAFESSYRPGLRKPYAVVSMIGLILYGIMHGVTSLRGLERMARLDLGCQWITGAIMPDHSVIGKFINRHAKLLNGSYFEELTRAVLKQTGGSATKVAGDGTVIQAAASRYGTLKAEAAATRARQARKEVEAAPHEIEAQQKAQEKEKQAEEVARIARERQEGRRAKGRDRGTAVVAPSEPEAVIQLMKNKAKAPAYKASITVNFQRIITGRDVDPSNEIKVVEGMLDQTERIGGRRVEQGQYDAGYFSYQMIAMALERNLDLLVPEGRARGEDDWEKSSSKQYPKNRFKYEPESDRYRCPGGDYLLPVRSSASLASKEYVKYQGTKCASCKLKTKCTTSPNGRSVKRYPGDEGKEALREVMQQEGARAQYRNRQAWVEPVFGELRGVQGLTRFKRRGLEKTKIEFSLHTMAHNLRRYLVLTGMEAQKILPVLLLLLSLICTLCVGGGESSGSRQERSGAEKTSVWLVRSYLAALKRHLSLRIHRPTLA